MSIGQRLKMQREKKGLTQEQLSEKTDISLSSIKNYENDRYDLPVTKLIKLSDTLNCSFTWLATGKFSKTIDFTEQEIELFTIFKYLENEDKIESLDYMKYRYEKSKKK